MEFEKEFTWDDETVIDFLIWKSYLPSGKKNIDLIDSFKCYRLNLPKNPAEKKQFSAKDILDARPGKGVVAFMDLSLGENCHLNKDNLMIIDKSKLGL